MDWHELQFFKARNRSKFTAPTSYPFFHLVNVRSVFCLFVCLFVTEQTITQKKQLKRKIDVEFISIEKVSWFHRYRAIEHNVFLSFFFHGIVRTVFRSVGTFCSSSCCYSFICNDGTSFHRIILNGTRISKYQIMTGN